MRKLFAFNKVSLDGYFEGPDRDIIWRRVNKEFNWPKNPGVDDV